MGSSLSGRAGELEGDGGISSLECRCFAGRRRLRACCGNEGVAANRGACQTTAECQACFCPPHEGRLDRHSDRQTPSSASSALIEQSEVVMESPRHILIGQRPKSSSAPSTEIHLNQSKCLSKCFSRSPCYRRSSISSWSCILLLLSECGQQLEQFVD